MKLSCDTETCNPEIKAALLKMLQKQLGGIKFVMPFSFRSTGAEWTGGMFLPRCIL